MQVKDHGWQAVQLAEQWATNSVNRTADVWHGRSKNNGRRVSARAAPAAGRVAANFLLALHLLVPNTVNTFQWGWPE